MHNGISLLDINGNPIPDPIDAGHGGAALDFEDQGQKAFNYRSERFYNRLQKNPQAHLVMSSGNVFNLVLEAGASQFPGDYAYRSGIFRWDVELGMWGILRIYDKLEMDLMAINGNDKFWQCFDWKHKIFMNMIKLLKNN